ncbi:conserved hypothetical protein [Ricinus communis]|uniref:Uncharacterized protein n=1 Tax=Ricinus communis TaxID=3988 RepID=B9RE22_RICCO|nr:conserved hypothetical protein [Ricinus communis]
MGVKLRTSNELHIYVDHTNGNASGGEKYNQPFVQVGSSSQDSGVTEKDYNDFIDYVGIFVRQQNKENGDGAQTQEENEEVNNEDEIGGMSDDESTNSSQYIDNDDLGSYYSNYDNSCVDEAKRRGLNLMLPSLLLKDGF